MLEPGISSGTPPPSSAIAGKRPTASSTQKCSRNRCCRAAAKSRSSSARSRLARRRRRGRRWPGRPGRRTPGLRRGRSGRRPGGRRGTAWRPPSPSSPGCSGRGRWGPGTSGTRRSYVPGAPGGGEQPGRGAGRVGQEGTDGVVVQSGLATARPAGTATAGWNPRRRSTREGGGAPGSPARAPWRGARAGSCRVPRRRPDRIWCPGTRPGRAACRRRARRRAAGAGVRPRASRVRTGEVPRRAGGSERGVGQRAGGEAEAVELVERVFEEQAQRRRTARRGPARGGRRGGHHGVLAVVQHSLPFDVERASASRGAAPQEPLAGSDAAGGRDGQVPAVVAPAQRRVVRGERLGGLRGSG